MKMHQVYSYQSSYQIEFYPMPIDSTATKKPSTEDFNLPERVNQLENTKKNGEVSE